MVIFMVRTHSYDEMSLGGIARGGGRVRLSRLLLDPDTASASVLRRQSWHSETMAEARSVSDLARHYYRWESPIQTTMYLFIDIHNIQRRRPLAPSPCGKCLVLSHLTLKSLLYIEFKWFQLRIWDFRTLCLQRSSFKGSFNDLL